MKVRLIPQVPDRNSNKNPEGLHQDNTIISVCQCDSSQRTLQLMGQCLFLLCIWFFIVCILDYHGAHMLVKVQLGAISSVSRCVLQGWARVTRLISKYLDAPSYLSGPMNHDI